MPQGLTSREASARLQQYGPNVVAEGTVHPWPVLLQKFWTPVPWMLEFTIGLELVCLVSVKVGTGVGDRGHGLSHHVASPKVWQRLGRAPGTSRTCSG